jgi:hypothetical protein
MERGKRHAVCDKTFNLYQSPPYREHFAFIEPLTDIPLADAQPFNRPAAAIRHPKETKGREYNATTVSTGCCDGGNCC